MKIYIFHYHYLIADILSIFCIYRNVSLVVLKQVWEMAPMGPGRYRGAQVRGVSPKHRPRSAG